MAEPKKVSGVNVIRPWLLAFQGTLPMAMFLFLLIVCPWDAGLLALFTMLTVLGYIILWPAWTHHGTVKALEALEARLAVMEARTQGSEGEGLGTGGESSS